VIGFSEFPETASKPNGNKFYTLLKCGAKIGGKSNFQNEYFKIDAGSEMFLSPHPRPLSKEEGETLLEQRN
jgi:hypothetical protein